jgi:hypothetical protein
VNGDGFDDIIVGAGPGAPGGHVKTFDGASGAETFSISAYGGFTGGVYVATGDVNGDGFDDIIVGAGPDAPGGHVKVFDGASGGEIRSFLAFDGFTGGVYVATGDVNGDGRDDIIISAGPGAPGGHVKVFDGAGGGEIASFFAFGGFNGGVYVATGDVNGDGFDDIVIGADAGASGHVKYFNGRFLAGRDLISARADFDVLISGAGDENDSAANNTDNNHGTHVAGTIGAMGN